MRELNTKKVLSLVSLTLIREMLLNEVSYMDIDTRELIELYEEGYILRISETDDIHIVHLSYEKVDLPSQLPQ